MTKETKKLLEQMAAGYDNITPEEVKKCLEEELKSDVLETFKYELNRKNNRTSYNHLCIILSEENPKSKLVAAYGHIKEFAVLFELYWNQLDEVVDILIEKIVEIDKEAKKEEQGE